MDEAQLVKQVTRATGNVDGNVVRTAILEVVRNLGAHLPPALSGRAAERLPAAFGSALGSSAATVGRSVETMYDRVGETTGLRMPKALELAQAAVRVLARAFGPTLCAEIGEALPADWSALLTAPEPVVGARPRVRAVAAPEAPVHTRQTLASGRPGSLRPLASSRPAEAHRHSIAAHDDPHGETKLASAPGTRRDRREDTLARGRPGSEHPLSEADDGS